jgi:hypothetical protein
LVIVSSVVNVFEATRKSVRDEAERQIALRVVFQRLVRHHRTQIRPANADVDDVFDPLAGMALPFAGAHPLGEPGHLVQDRVDLGHHVLAVDLDGLGLRRAQRDVQHRAILRHVDLVAAKHRVTMFGQPGLFRELKQQLQRLVVDAVL